VAVATSGGRDSTALLHSTLRQALPLGIEVLALHVHHGLLLEADGWLAQVRTQSRRWGAAFDCRRLSGAPAKGQSVEALGP
jgi:tRNA(Ile)-lysidine synthase